MIYNKEPIDVLWDLTRDLMYNGQNKIRSNAIPIYKEIMHEEENKIPESYILLRSQLTDTTAVFGDGNGLIRSADCDIVLVTKGYAGNSNDLHNINKIKIRQQLKNKGVNFQEYNLGYDDSMKATQHNFTLEIDYLG